MISRDEAAQGRPTKAPTKALKVYHSCLGTFTPMDVAMGLVGACGVLVTAALISIAVLFLGLAR